MAQICAWFSDTTHARIEASAKKANTSKSKMVVTLVEQALSGMSAEAVNETIKEKDEQLGLALHNLNQLQNEIIPPLKLLLENNQDETEKRGFWASLLNR